MITSKRKVLLIKKKKKGVKRNTINPAGGIELPNHLATHNNEDKPSIKDSK